ncbi:MAG TPA: MlaD family protein [Solirubrobacteraceae bacterium]|nr:MlaD family protein [Solirubrobacteraceae bacterium]
MRRHRPRVSNLAAGIIAAVVIAAAVYLAFGGSTPFASSPFVLKAVFTTETQLHIPSPVRIAGVDVGQVVSVKPLGGNTRAAVVTMDINSGGLPIHKDATVGILTRIFLEGNFYVDLHPGTPNAPVLSSGGTLPAPQTSGPVQLDRVLNALTSGSRQNLQALVQGLGASLNGQPAAGEDAAQNQDPSVQGLTGAQALNKSLNYSAGAFKASAIVNQALLGIQPHDLSGSVQGNEQIFRALASRQTQLASLVTTFDRTMAGFAARQGDLSATIAALPPLLRTTNGALTSLDASFGPTKAFAKEILPGIEQLDPTIGQALPWLAQATALVSPSELGGLVSDLTPAVQDTAKTLNESTALLQASDALGRCVVQNLVPTGNTVIQDPPLTTGVPVYQELLESAVGIAGAGQGFDGNGRYLRSTPAGGSDQVQTGNLGSQGPLFGNAVLAPLGTRPAFPGHAPPVKGTTPCYQNAAPDLNRVTTGAGP